MKLHGCPCGNYGDATRECRCTGAIIQRYLSKLSGPLLDRIDLHIEVPAVAYKELRGARDGVSSAEMRERVSRTREVQQGRGYYNAHIPSGICASYVRWTMPANARWRWPSAGWDCRPARTTGS